MKYSGSGNTFIIQEGAKPAPVFNETFDADGLLVLSKGDRWKLEIFNRDGSAAPFCGNGLRCAAYYLRKRGLIGQEAYIDTPVGTHGVQVGQEGVEVQMPPPSQIAWDVTVDVMGERIVGHFIVVGVPHFVLLSKPKIPFDSLAPHLRSHPHFAPHGTNVNLVLDGQVATYERGVEDFTASCGSGTMASYVAITRGQKEPPPMTFTGLGGEYLTVKKNGDHWYLRGTVKECNR